MRALAVVGLVVVLSGTPALTFAQPASLRLDLAKLSRLIVYHPTLLARDGYGATYIVNIPANETGTFFRQNPSSEFDEIQVESERGVIIEVRTSKIGEPSTLVVRIGQSGLTAYWDLPVTMKIPPPPPGAEVRRRFDLGANLFAKARDALGLKDFKGGESGAIEVRLTGVEDLTLGSRGGEAAYTYAFFALGKEGMFEELEAEWAGTTLTIGIGAERVTVRRKTGEPGSPETVLELTMEGTAWEASRETTRPGENSAVEGLPRPEAERLLAEGLQSLRNARVFFGIGFGRDLSAIRLP